MGTEETSDYHMAVRWRGHEDDHETYNFIFDEAIYMLASDQKAVPALLMAVINAWEKDERSVPLQVLANALSVAQESQEIRERVEEISIKFLEPS